MYLDVTQYILAITLVVITGALMVYFEKRDMKNWIERPATKEELDSEIKGVADALTRAEEHERLYEFLKDSTYEGDDYPAPTPVTEPDEDDATSGKLGI